MSWLQVPAAQQMPGDQLPDVHEGSNEHHVSNSESGLAAPAADAASAVVSLGRLCRMLDVHFSGEQAQCWPAFICFALASRVLWR